MSYMLTLLGTGSSGGVPRIGNDWGACDPRNPKNRRRRCAALLQRTEGRGTTHVLIDTPPDLRDQLLDVGIGTLDGVLYTHDHADHAHGIDELRIVALNMRRRIDVHADAATSATLHTRFGYCFQAPPDSAYPPILNAYTITPPTPVLVHGAGGSIETLPVVQQHGDITSLGFRVHNVAYSPDVSDLSEDAVAALAGLDLWIVDALRYRPHPSHFSVAQALEWIERVKPKRAILTHLHVDLDYETLRRELPPHVVPAYDGLSVHFD
jgi:phosphoribosyl 1,2-cyclic phosphate phosphodiesterase